MAPEQKARQQIDDLLRHAGWDVQDREEMNLFQPDKPGVAVREAHLRTGFADYLLFVEGQALGVIGAKRSISPANYPSNFSTLSSLMNATAPFILFGGRC